jgi:hypothetical protein
LVVAMALLFVAMPYLLEWLVSELPIGAVS